MQFVRNSLFMRSTTMFGVCEALGEDLKINATWFRVAFAVGVIFNLEYAVAAYAVAGVIVLISRLAYPGRRPAEVAAVTVAQTDTAVVAETPAEKALAQAA